MQVTDVRVVKSQTENSSRVKATASVTLDNDFAVHGIKIIAGEASNFISFPSRKMINGEYRDIAHPINAEMRQVLEDAVLKAYHEALAQLEVAAE